MANPLPNEEEVYRRIEEENINIPSFVWELLDHHIRNDLNVISLGWGNFLINPPWLLRLLNSFFRFIYRLSGQRGEADNLIELAQTTVNRVMSVDRFLKKVREATLKE